jgi:hypothetical protein
MEADVDVNICAGEAVHPSTIRVTFRKPGAMGLRFTSAELGMPLRIEALLEGSPAWVVSRSHHANNGGCKFSEGLALVAVGGVAVGARSHAQALALMRQASEARPLALDFAPHVSTMRGGRSPRDPRPRRRGSLVPWSDGCRDEDAPRRGRDRAPLPPGRPSPSPTSDARGSGAPEALVPPGPGSATSESSATNSPRMVSSHLFPAGQPEPEPELELATSPRVAVAAAHTELVPPPVHESSTAPGRWEADGAGSSGGSGGGGGSDVGAAIDCIPLLPRTAARAFADMQSGSCCEGCAHAQILKSCSSTADLPPVCHSEASSMKLRVGPNYRRTGACNRAPDGEWWMMSTPHCVLVCGSVRAGRKEPSGPALFEFVGASLLRSDQRVQNLLQQRSPPADREPLPVIPGATCLPHYVALNIQLPLGPAQIMNPKRDGVTMNFVLLWVSHTPYRQHKLVAHVNLTLLAVGAR